MVECVRCGRKNETFRLTCYGCGHWLPSEAEETGPSAPRRDGGQPGETALDQQGGRSRSGGQGGG